MKSAYFMVYGSNAKHSEQGAITELPFNKGVKSNVFIEIGHKRCDSDKGP